MTDEPGGHQAFFEDRYRSAQRDSRTIPWASLKPNRYVVDQARTIDPRGRRAVVVGCGLGDDAEYLASLGWVVTAFDVSPSAIAWCRERFERSAVGYVVADLFEPAPEWLERFSLVVEVATIQSLAPEHRRRTIAAIAALVGADGTLLVSAIGRVEGDHESGPPWPVKRDELRWFESFGLDEVSFASEPSPWEGFERFNVMYTRTG